MVQKIGNKFFWKLIIFGKLKVWLKTIKLKSIKNKKIHLYISCDGKVTLGQG